MPSRLHGHPFLPLPREVQHGRDPVVPRSHRRVVVSSSGHKTNERLSRVKCLATLVPVVAANCSVLVSFLILKASKTGMVRGFRKLKEFRTRPSWPHYVAATRSGYTNRRLWRQMLDRVKKVWHQHHPGLNCLIYMDNCSPHRSGDDSTLEDDFILRLARQNIHCCFLPPNTTAWLQPLDDVAFGQLKLVLGRKHRDRCFDASITRDADGTLSLTDALEVERAAFSEATIKASWRNTGMSKEPACTGIDPSKINSLARRNDGLSAGTQRSLCHKAKRLVLDILATSTGRAQSSSQPLTLTLDHVDTTDQIDDLRRSQKNRRRSAAESRAQRRIQKETLSRRSVQEERLPKKREQTQSGRRKQPGSCCPTGNGPRLLPERRNEDREIGAWPVTQLTEAGDCGWHV